MVSDSQKHSSIEHKELIDISLKHFDGEEIIIRGSSNIKGKYFPDVKTNNSDIECEILPKSYLKKKADKWDSNRNKILVCGFNKFSLDNFNEIFVNCNGKLIKIK